MFYLPPIHLQERYVKCFSTTNASCIQTSFSSSSRGPKTAVLFNPRVRKGLIPDFGRTRSPDYCLIICKVDLLYRFRVNGVFMPRVSRSSKKTRLESESLFTSYFLVKKSRKNGNLLLNVQYNKGNHYIFKSTMSRD